MLHLLLEHKSGADRWTPLQTLGYTVRLWEAHRRRAPRSRWLPPVITVVVHHGRRGWTGTTDVFDLVELEDDLRPHVRALLHHRYGPSWYGGPADAAGPLAQREARECPSPPPRRLARALLVSCLTIARCAQVPVRL